MEHSAQIPVADRSYELLPPIDHAQHLPAGIAIERHAAVPTLICSASRVLLRAMVYGQLAQLWRHWQL